jgi:hypothetical protein
MCNVLVVNKLDWFENLRDPYFHIRKSFDLTLANLRLLIRRYRNTNLS